MKPTIVLGTDPGAHNRDLPQAQDRILRGKTYRNCATVCVIPSRDIWYPRVVQTWFNLMTPMNNAFLRMAAIGYEVGDAYSNALDVILAHPELSKWPYMLTLETDNMPPPDGLLKLIESLEGEPKYDVVGGLYWTKGEGGQPMCYGNPADMPLNFRPWLPQPGTVARANGLGMGFNLWRLSMFKDSRLPRPFFRTVQEHTPEGTRQYTQDLSFFERAGALGYKFACDTRVLVGHYDPVEDKVW